MNHIGFKDIPQQEIKDIKFHGEHVADKPRIPDPNALNEEPSLIDLMGNFYGFVSRLAVQGFKVVSRECYVERTRICEGCSLYDKEARGGLGKCNHKGCGCTNIKRWFAFEKCPQQLWGEYRG